jgi:DNA-directed RNA polymerase subunit RPC12/RpoP
LAFEETDEGYLLGQVLQLAEVDGTKRYFPCPKCGSRLLVEEYAHDDGKLRVRVCGFEPSAR